ncbi:MAG: AMP-binding protein [Pseudomonadales bacterium]|jgi:fatty-acyl-CoA synthase|nr:AMP-binding protein [Pseudomonadales bacterium]
MDFHFANAFELIADTVPERPALLCDGQVRSWHEFDTRAARLATVLEQHGIDAGAKVGLYQYNCNEYTESHLAAFKLGAVPINVNYRYQADELVYLLDNADAQAVIFHGEFAPRIAEIRDRLPRIRLFLQIDDGSGAPLGPGVLDYAAAVEAAPPRARAPRPGSDVYMLYTGGTTGMPKGVMYANGDFCQSMTAGFAVRGLPRPERLEALPALVTQLAELGMAPVSLPACPQMHGTGMWIGTLIPLLMGGAVLTRRTPHFDPPALFRDVARHRVTDLVIVGDAFARPMVAELDAARDRGEPHDLSSLALVTSSGVMWSAEVKQGLLAHHDMMLYDAMGSTEGSMGANVSNRQTPAQTAKFALGEGVRVFTDDDREVTPGSEEIGMVATSGLVPLGYYKDPEKSARTFREVRGVRYAFPGDYARVEADGTITLLGRGSQCINTGGEKVFTEEVEEAAKRHPAVQDCLVVGLPDLRFGNRVVAVISLTEASLPDDPDDDRLRDFMRTQLAGYKLPRAFVRVPRVQRAPNGKADYKWARRVAEEALS